MRIRLLLCTARSNSERACCAHAFLMILARPTSFHVASHACVDGWMGVCVRVCVFVGVKGREPLGVEGESTTIPSLAVAIVRKP